MVYDYMEGSQGNCPVCGSDNLTYGAVQDCDVGICYPWVCYDCGASCYSIDFDSHQDVCVKEKKNENKSVVID